MGSHSKQDWAEYRNKNITVTAEAKHYDQEMTAGQIKPRYLFNNNVLEPADLTISSTEIKIEGHKRAIKL
jgi:hypothetical protein